MTSPILRKEESSRMPDTKVDFKDVWTAVKDVAKLADSSASYSMGDPAFVVPKGLQPWDLDWSEQFQQDLSVRRRWGNRCSDEYLDLGLFTIEIDCSPTVVRIGGSFKAGGRYGGQGRYIHDAYVWGVVDSTSMGVGVEIKGGFHPNPVTIGNGVAQLTGEIHVHVTQFGLHFTDELYDVLMQGDGYGYLQ